MPTLVQIDVLVAAVAVVLIALTPFMPEFRRPRWTSTLGIFLIAVPLPSAVLLQPTFRGNTTVEHVVLFVTLLCFVTGALLLRPADDGGGEGGSSDEPPWWPEFEEAFRRYDRQVRPRGPRVRVPA